MLAKDLLEQIPVVHPTTGALEAARIIATLRVTGVIVVDDEGQPIAVLPGVQVLRSAVPGYVWADPKLAHAYDEAGADEVLSGLAQLTVADLMHNGAVEAEAIPEVQPQDTMIEIAAVMVEQGTAVVQVRNRDGDRFGFVTQSRLLAAILVAAGDESPPLRATLAEDLADLHDSPRDRDSPHHPPHDPPDDPPHDPPHDPPNERPARTRDEGPGQT